MLVDRVGVECFNFLIQSHGDDEEFRHDWIATSAELHETGNVMAAESEDIIMLEDQQDNMFDYEVWRYNNF
jgi:hypothetical protein